MKVDGPVKEKTIMAVVALYARGDFRTVTLHRVTAPQCPVSRAFVTAVLLTGSAEGAEAAVLEGIRSSETGDVHADAFLLRVVSEAVKAQSEPPPRRSITMESASLTLPVELQPLLRLPTTLRRCFVLRYLLGMSRELCGRLLDLGIDQVDEATGMSAEALARLAKEEKAA